MPRPVQKRETAGKVLRSSVFHRRTTMRSSTLSRVAAFFLTLVLLGGSSPSHAGQAQIVPVRELLERSLLVVVVDVTEVTAVEVPTGKRQVSKVYVAEAEVAQTLKTDRWPTPEQRKIAIVGSTIPRSSAAWRPIEKTRYLAFLNPDQGHYRYSARIAMRPVSPEGKVEWHEKNARGEFEILEIELEQALKRIRNELSRAEESSNAD